MAACFEMYIYSWTNVQNKDGLHLKTEVFSIFFICIYAVVAIIFRGVQEPIVTVDVLHQQELSQEDGKRVDVKQWRKGEENFASGYVDEGFIASGSHEQEENAKLHAIEEAMTERKAL